MQQLALALLLLLPPLAAAQTLAADKAALLAFKAGGDADVDASFVEGHAPGVHDHDAVDVAAAQVLHRVRDQHDAAPGAPQCCDAFTYSPASRPVSPTLSPVDPHV